MKQIFVVMNDGGIPLAAFNSKDKAIQWAATHGMAEDVVFELNIIS